MWHKGKINVGHLRMDSNCGSIVSLYSEIRITYCPSCTKPCMRQRITIDYIPSNFNLSN